MKIDLLSKLSPRHKKLLAMIKESKGRLILAVICMQIVAAATAASTYLVKPALDDVFVNKDSQMLLYIPLAIVLVFFVKGVGMYGEEYFMSYVGQKIIRNLRNILYEKISDLPLAFFHQEKTGGLMSRVTNDVNIVKNMVSSVVTGAIRDFFQIVFLIGLIIWLHWKLALIALVILPLGFYPIVVFGRRLRKVSTGWQETMADLNAFLHETFAGNKIVKAFGMEYYEKQRFFKKSHDLFLLEMKAVIARALPSPMIEIFGGLGIAFVIWYGGTQVVEGQLTVGTFLAFLAATATIYDPVKKLSRLNAALQEGLAATDRIFDIIETESGIKDPPHPVSVKYQPHHVSFEGVNFKYDQALVLRDINLDVRPGEVVALVGMSGGGKSSLVNLIPRFYDICDGHIRIDGIDIRDVAVEELRKQIAIVTQEPILFNDSVRNNIAYGNPQATDTEIEGAAKAAYAYEFINSFPQKMQTSIGELGSRLSGGEKQRICIARALLKDAPILILDEATSSLDTEAELTVQKALENLMKGRTTFVIAHRLSTILNSDRIVVIVGGKIKEEGTHQTLLELKGEYFKLYHMQFNNGRMDTRESEA